MTSLFFPDSVILSLRLQLFRPVSFFYFQTCISLLKIFHFFIFLSNFSVWFFFVCSLYKVHLSTHRIGSFPLAFLFSSTSWKTHVFLSSPPKKYPSLVCTCLLPISQFMISSPLSICAFSKARNFFCVCVLAFAPAPFSLYVQLLTIIVAGRATALFPFTFFVLFLASFYPFFFKFLWILAQTRKNPVREVVRSVCLRIPCAMVHPTHLAVCDSTFLFSYFISLFVFTLLAQMSCTRNGLCVCECAFICQARAYSYLMRNASAKARFRDDCTFFFHLSLFFFSSVDNS